MKPLFDCSSASSYAEPIQKHDHHVRGTWGVTQGLFTGFAAGAYGPSIGQPTPCAQTFCPPRRQARLALA
jgi:hypothetical protein